MTTGLFHYGSRRWGSRRDTAGWGNRRRKLQRRATLERLEDRRLLTTPPLILSFNSGTDQLVLGADSTVTSLSVTFNSSAQAFTFTANEGETFSDTSLPSSVSFSTTSNSATLTASWSSLSYTLEADFTNPSGTAVTLGASDGSAPVSNFGVGFALSGSISSLTLNDQGDTTGTSLSPAPSSLTSGQVTFDNSETIDYSSLAFTSNGSLTVNTGSGYGMFTVTGTPAGATTDLDTNPASATVKAITLGGSTSQPAASTLGAIDIAGGGSGTTTLIINDAADPTPSQIISLAAPSGSATVSFSTSSSASFTFSGLQDAGSTAGLTIEGGTGGTGFVVTGTPVSATTQIETDPASGTVDSVTLGGSTAPTAAFTLGNVSVTAGGSGATTLTINDAADPTAGQSISLSEISSTGTLTFGMSSSASFTFSGLQDGSATAGLTIEGGTGNDTFTVTGSPTDASTQIDTNPASAAVDSITLGGSTSPTAAINLGRIDIAGGGAGRTTVVVDDSADLFPDQGVSLSASSSSATLTFEEIFPPPCRPSS